MAADNKSLGKFTLDGIPPAPRGVPQIEVTFDMDANSILKVTAKDKATNRQQDITISGSSGLSDEEVERMRQDAESHANEDQKHRELIEARNTADNAVYTAEKTLKELGDKVSADAKTKVDNGVTRVRLVRDNSDASVIHTAVEDLMKILQEIGQAAYAQQEQAPQPEDAQPSEGDQGETPDEPEVVEGEYTEAE